MAESGGGPGVGNAMSDDIVISLTSFGERLALAHLAVESLLRQRLRADRVVLCVPVSYRAQAEANPLLLRQQERGLSIRYCAKDYGPFTKYFYTMQDWPDSLVVTVDDDMIYPADMLDRLYAAYRRQPEAIHCHRGHGIRRRRGRLRPYKQWEWNTPSTQASLDIFPTGVGGVMYFPGSLHPDAFNDRLFSTLSPQADDVWLKAMSLLRDTPCRVVPRYLPWRVRFVPIKGSQAFALKRLNKHRRLGNDAKLARTLAWYGVGAGP
ncbi:hypothetical protein [Parahaliea mediterranea]|uniref:Uncharacterized protein n=1 Tax=Parahaliea mediterranea TaxID=651086 RepID=A0A939INC5_9GAMM|nr:hypothetical protein [Parahaliea mediterranea]MBN7798420.1 hypothetical protein [Parahaliea mediterranea]